MGSLDGRVAIVTGGAGVIGRAYSRGLVQEGCAVVVADLLEGSAVVAELERGGGKAAAIQVDVSDRESTEAMARQAYEKFGRIDILINNAAYFTETRRSAWDKIDIEEWDKAFAINVRGVWLCSRAVFPYMREQQYGKIINIASNVVWAGVGDFLHYIASKSAILGLTRGMARAVGEFNIAVNTVAPDYIPNPRLDEINPPGTNEAVVEERIIKRTETPEDVVGTIVFLSGPGSDFITGQSLLVNGGASLQ